MDIFLIEAAQDTENPVSQEALQIAPQPSEPVMVPWVVRSLLHSLRHGGEDCDDDLNRAQDLPAPQLLALVNTLTRGTSEVHVLHVIYDWYEQLKRARAPSVEESFTSIALAA